MRFDCQALYTYKRKRQTMAQRIYVLKIIKALADKTQGEKNKVND